MYDFYIADRKVDDILDFEYSENLEDVACSFSFSALKDYGVSTNDKLNTIKLCEKGKTTPFFLGVITDCEHTSNENIWKYDGFDVGFYLNKNEVLTQFKDTNITDAIKSLCAEYKVNVTLPQFQNKITQIYKDEVFGDVLKELLKFEADKGGIRDVYIDCKNGKLEIKQYNIEQNLSAQIANNILIDTNKTYNSISVKTSIQELKNRVIYTDNDEKSVKKFFSISPESITKYGMLTSVEKIDTSKNNNLQQLADNKVAELNKEKTEISLSMLGDYRISKGKLIYFDIPRYNLKGTYLITQSKHTITNTKDYVSVSIQYHSI